jgi:hypothetical protein
MKRYRPARLMAVTACLALGAAAFGLMAPALAADPSPDSDVTTPGTTLILPQPGDSSAGEPQATSPVASHTVLHGDVITLRLEDQGDRYRVEHIELLGPNGLHVTATDATRQVEHSVGFSSDNKSGSGVGVRGSNGGAALTFGAGQNHAGANYDDTKLAITRAHVRVPDLAAYKADVTLWKFRVKLLDDEGHGVTIEIPAPAASPAPQ